VVSKDRGKDDCTGESEDERGTIMTQLAADQRGRSDGFEVLTEELRATKREINKTLDRHQVANLDGAGLGADCGHDELMAEIGDFVAELDRCEQDFRQRAEDTGDSLDFAAFCYDNTDHWIAKVWLSAVGGQT